MDNLFINKIIESFSLSKISAELLVNRGLTTFSRISAFLNPSQDNLSCPFSIYGMEQAVNLINIHIEKQSKILIFGDYDCDGIGSAAILYLAFSKKGFIPDVFLPNREEDGYGLTEDTIKKVMSEYKPNLIITVDCGIQAYKEVELLNESGIDIIITDHHEPGDNLPNCICVNPKIKKDIDELSGAGVTWMLVNALYGLNFAMEYIDICAVSTVSDLVPLVDNNRIIVALGLKKMNSNQSQLGLKSIIDYAMRIEGRNKILKSSDIAYRIGPRLNASGRISTAFKSFKLLTSKNVNEINELTIELEVENNYRQELCKSTIQAVKQRLFNYDLANHKIIVLYEEKWEAGIIGIAASKIAEEFCKPTILLTKNGDALKGSCRSIKGISIYDLLKNNSQLLNHFGGHDMAAGLSINEANLDRFIESCDRYIESKYNHEVFKFKKQSDIELTITDVTLKLADELALFEPFGMDNRKPSFSVKFNEMSFSPINFHPHIKWALSKEVHFIGFNKIGFLELLNSKIEKIVNFSIEFDSYKGNKYASCSINDIILCSYDLCQELLIFNDLVRFLPIRDSDNYIKTFMPNSHFGTVILVWDYTDLLFLMNQYPDYIIEYNELSSFNTYNTILYSPNINICLGYFSKIIVYGTAPIAYIKHMDYTYSSVTYENNYNHFVRKYNVSLNKDTINMVYSYLRAYLPEIHKNHNNEIVYSFCKAKGLPISILQFNLCCIILIELGYLKILEDGIWMLGQSSKELNESEIYNRLNL